MGLVAPWHVGLPGPELEPVSLALAGGFLTTAPPGKSYATIKPFMFIIPVTTERP